MHRRPSPNLTRSSTFWQTTPTTEDLAVCRWRFGASRPAPGRTAECTPGAGGDPAAAQGACFRTPRCASWRAWPRARICWWCRPRWSSGFGVDAMLPMQLEHYAADFDSDSLALLRTLMARPEVRCTRATAEHAGGGRRGGCRHLGPGRALFGSCADPRPRMQSADRAVGRGIIAPARRHRGRGVALSRCQADRNKDDTRLQFLDAPADHEVPARLVYWIPAARAKAESRAGRRFALLSRRRHRQRALLRLPTMPHRLRVHLRSLGAYSAPSTSASAIAGAAVLLRTHSQAAWGRRWR